MRKLDINWHKETTNVREACYAMMKSHDIWECMSPEEKERFDELVDCMTIDDKPKESKSDAKNNTALPVS